MTKTPCYMARKQAYFSEEANTGQSDNYSDVNNMDLHDNVKYSTENIKCALCRYSTSQYLSHKLREVDLPSAKSEKRAPKLSMLRKTQSVQAVPVSMCEEQTL